MSDLTNALACYPLGLELHDEVVLIKARHGTHRSLSSILGGELGLKVLVFQFNAEAEEAYRAWVLAGSNAVQLVTEAVQSRGTDADLLYYSFHDRDGVAEFLSPISNWVRELTS